MKYLPAPWSRVHGHINLAPEILATSLGGINSSSQPPQPPNKCTSSPAAVPRCTYCQPSYCLRTACAALTHTCLSFPLSSPVLCAKHWLFQGRRGHQAANKYTLTTGRNNYCPVLPPLRVRGTVPILAHSLLVLTVVIRSA